MKSYYHDTLWQCRLVTSKFRDVPNFLIIGAMKCGTTSLHYYLDRHPHIVSAIKKEVHFFDGGINPNVDNYSKGISWYKAHFPLKKNIRENQKLFESSPLYLFNRFASQRIFKAFPKIKMIALLRNPTDRAISHYFHEKRMNRESLPIYEALKEEKKRIKPAIENKDFKSKEFIHYSYKSRGIYKEQIERFYKYFSKDQILIISSSNFFNNPYNTLNQIFEFIEIDEIEYQLEALKPKNVAKNKTDISPKVYEYLDTFFKPYNQALYDLIGQDFGWEHSNKPYQ